MGNIETSLLSNMGTCLSSLQGTNDQDLKEWSETSSYSQGEPITCCKVSPCLNIPLDQKFENDFLENLPKILPPLPLVPSAQLLAAQPNEISFKIQDALSLSPAVHQAKENKISAPPVVIEDKGTETLTESTFAPQQVPSDWSRSLFLSSAEEKKCFQDLQDLAFQQIIAGANAVSIQSERAFQPGRNASPPSSLSPFTSLDAAAASAQGQQRSHSILEAEEEEQPPGSGNAIGWYAKETLQAGEVSFEEFKGGKEEEETPRGLEASVLPITNMQKFREWPPPG